MPSDRWRRIEEIFRGAAELQGEAREAFLVREAGDDAALLDEVRSLLEHDASASGESIAAAVHEAFGPSPDPSPTTGAGYAGPGEHVGPYRIEREIGRGGMGAVYLAVRADDQFSKRVAIKVMRRRPGRPDLLQRFQTERQILATLEHPGIARMIDGGTTGAGEPYVVMEYVEGQSLDTYCNQRRLGVRDRLTLFRGICAAVQYAHRNLVVHRDLKPGNILVTHEGEVKLLDFGIAKLLDPALSPSPMAETATEFRVLTPEYASPEQVKGETITTATDVYSLGVVLFELLSGRRPYRLRKATTGDLEKAIVEQEPDRPSTAITRDEAHEVSGRTGDAETIGRERGTAPDRLRRQLTGDLDNIVLTALRKEPERRYPSAEALSEDVRRHLEGLPVVARPSTLGYRASKFVARHRLSLGVAAAVTVLVFSLVGYYTIRLGHARERAEVEARTNARVTEFLVGLFEKADPRKRFGKEMSVQDLLELGATDVEGSLEDAPEVRARLMRTMSTAYWNMGRNDRALELLDQALDLQQRIPGDRRAERSEMLGERAGILAALARYDEGREEAERALALSLQVHDAESEPVSRVRSVLGYVIERKGDPEAAAAIYKENLDVARRLAGGKDTNWLALTSIDLGRVVMVLGRNKEAIELFEDAVRIQGKLYPKISSQRADALNLLGAAHYRVGEYDKAESLYREALEVNRAVFGESSPNYSYQLSNLANVYKMRGEPGKAEPMLREVMELQEKAYGPEHPEVAKTLNNLANVLQDQERYAEAEPLLRRALEIDEKLVGKKHPETATALNNLASLLRQVGRFEEAEAMFQRTLDIDLETLGDEHAYVAMDYANMADLLVEMRRFDEADSLVAKALAIQEGNENINPYNLSSTYMVEGRSLLARGRHAEAEMALRQAVDLREKSLAGDSLALADARGLLGQCLLSLDRPEEARPLLEQSWKIIESKVPKGDKKRKRAAERLMNLYEASGDADGAARMKTQLGESEGA